MNRTLHHRIRQIGANRKKRQDQLTPLAAPSLPGQPIASAASSVTGGAASPGGVPMTMPTAAVMVYRTSDQYATIGYSDLEPIYTADGAAIMATGPGQWDQLAAAGNPRDGAQRLSTAKVRAMNRGAR
jgi:hypothetical protein